jgi:hypothetical protein
MLFYSITNNNKEEILAFTIKIPICRKTGQQFYFLEIFFLFLFSCILISTFGCASSRALGKLPTGPQDFNLSENEIKDKFPEISIYEKGKLKNVFGYCTPIKEVITLWGEPDDKKANWLRYHIPALGAVAVGSIAGGGIVGASVGTVIVLGMSPAPFQIYTWHKGNYVINVNIDTTIFCGYMKRLLYWEWVQVN